MDKIKRIALFTSLFVVLLSVSYQHHQAGYFCARTGSERGYEEYFHFIKLNYYYEKSWIQEVAEEKYDFTETDHDWRKTMGTYTNFLTKEARSHQSAPALHELRGFLVDTSKENFTQFFGIDNVEDFIYVMIHGNETERRTSIHYLLQE